MVRADRGRGFRRLSAMFFAIVLAGSLSACASSNPTTPSATASTSAAATPPPSKSAAPSSSLNSSVLVSPPSKGSTAASGAAGVTTLTGTVAGGVESGCIVLTDDAGTVLANLMGLDTKAAPIGSKVQVTGEFETDMMTTCQQGMPFSVTDVQIQN